MIDVKVLYSVYDLLLHCRLVISCICWYTVYLLTVIVVKVLVVY